MKGQVALEYLIVLGLSLAILLPLWLYVNGQLGDTRAQLQTTYAQLAVRKLADAADLVYVQGPPAQMFVQTTFPDNLASATAGGNEIMLRLSTAAGPSDVYAVTLGTVSGTLPSHGGPIVLYVKAQGSGVLISEVG